MLFVIEIVDLLMRLSCEASFLGAIGRCKDMKIGYRLRSPLEWKTQKILKNQLLAMM